MGISAAWDYFKDGLLPTTTEGALGLNAGSAIGNMVGSLVGGYLSSESLKKGYDFAIDMNKKEQTFRRNMGLEAKTAESERLDTQDENAKELLTLSKDLKNSQLKYEKAEVDEKVVERKFVSDIGLAIARRQAFKGRPAATV